MRYCIWSTGRPVLLASSEDTDWQLIEGILDELRLGCVLVTDAVEAMQALCRRPNTFAAVVVGERVGQVSGFTLCGLARDAGCALPMLHLTQDDCRWAAARAARLRVTVLWQPVSSRRLVRALQGLLPRRLCRSPSQAAWRYAHSAG